MNEQEIKIIRIPKDATNGEVLMRVFPKVKTRGIQGTFDFIDYTLDGIVGNAIEQKWWDALYNEIDMIQINDNDLPIPVTKNNEKIQIAKHFGLELQMQQLIEEMAELTQAICKHKRKNGEGQSLDTSAARHVEENLIEELADVKLVLEQVILLLHAESDVQKVVNQKIERTLERISDEERKKKGDETNKWWY